VAAIHQGVSHLQSGGKRRGASEATNALASLPPSLDNEGNPNQNQL
jgi:hypothetical protein